MAVEAGERGRNWRVASTLLLSHTGSETTSVYRNMHGFYFYPENVVAVVVVQKKTAVLIPAACSLPNPMSTTQFKALPINLLQPNHGRCIGFVVVAVRKANLSQEWMGTTVRKVKS